MPSQPDITRTNLSPPARTPAVHRAIEHMVAAVYTIPVEELRAPSRSKADVAFARQVAMYLVHVAGGVSLTMTGRLFGRDRTTAAHACSLVEDRRDNPEFDHTLTRIEQAIHIMARTAGFSDPQLH